MCVPIKDLKNTTAFAETIENSDGPVIVTRNGREAFIAMRPDDYDALRREAARAELYRLVDEAEADFAAGRYSDAFEFHAEMKAKYGL